MRKCLPYLLIGIIQLLILKHCNTTQHFVPIRPVPQGNIEGYMSLSVSLNRLTRPAIQGGVYYGVSANDAIGLGMLNMFLPSYFSYIRYWDTREHQGTVQIHVNDLWGFQHNPTYECNVSLTFPERQWQQSLTVGLGYYATPIIGHLVGVHIQRKQLVPLISYQLQHQEYKVEVQYISQFTQYHIRLYKGYDYFYAGPPSEFAPSEVIQIYAHNSVRDIIQHGQNILDESTWWEIALAHDDTLLIMPQDPYADCIGCARDKFYQSAYLASPAHRVMWVYPKDYWEKDVSPKMLELNMEAILSAYNHGGELRLVQDDDLLERTLHTVKPWRDNWFFSIGKRWYE